MTYVRSVDCEQLRIVLCFDFDPHAPPGEISALKNSLIDCPNTLHSIETTGDFDFIAEVAPPDLTWYNAWLKTLADPIAKLVRRCSTAYVCKRYIRQPKEEDCLWVQSAGGGLRRIDCALIDKIVAEGDYARVYSRGQSWLMHATMHALHDRLSSRQFVQLHRSVIVRSDFIERLVRDGRHWSARLGDGTYEQVAKSHVTETLQVTHLAKNVPVPSN